MKNFCVAAMMVLGLAINANAAYAAGDWTYRLYDSWDTVDEGSVGDIGLNYTPIPEPGTLGLMALIGLALAAVRMRKQLG